MKEIWYFAGGLPYPENEPDYYKTDDFPALAEMEKHWAEIKTEIKSFIDEKDSGFQANNYQDVKVEGGWSSLPYVFWGVILSKELRKKCPALAGYLDQIPGLVSLSLSRLSPHSSIARHRGDTNAVIRCHFGIEVPGSLPLCGIKVAEQERGWEEGKWTLFNDAYIHSAWNNSDKRRVVLIVDLLRPEFLKQKNSICAHILTYQIINNQLGRNKSFNESSFFTRKILFTFVYTGILLYRPLQNFAKSIF